MTEKEAFRMGVGVTLIVEGLILLGIVIGHLLG